MGNSQFSPTPNRFSAVPIAGKRSPSPPPRSSVPFQLIRNHVEVEFVMHLKDHLRTQFSFSNRSAMRIMATLMIGGTSLDRCVDGVPFRVSPYGSVAGVDIGQNRFAKQCLHVPFSRATAMLSSCNFSREGDKILIDQVPCLSPGDIEPLRKAKRRDAVNNPEVSGFSFVAHLTTNLLKGYLENF